MTYTALSPGAVVAPIPPGTYLLPAVSGPDSLLNSCGREGCVNTAHEKIFSYTPKEDDSKWQYRVMCIPLMLIAVVLVTLIAWITITANSRYKAYEDALDQRLIDAMDEEEKEVYA
ncbi:GPI mannosyltransferase [Babesia ovata]|uniref:GPI mannosyltransferase n=1 Tax=Babesia ovata TaxID=189622 RepID=A0A2H6KHF3_9APIC|nr:GPI mannosyltransferase [Babesia ovata]GBE62420.1 GPI mannosyltransferase [Babesia ovata]